MFHKPVRRGLVASAAFTGKAVPGFPSPLGMRQHFREGTVVPGGQVVTQEAKRKLRRLNPEGKGRALPVVIFIGKYVFPDLTQH